MPESAAAEGAAASFALDRIRKRPDFLAAARGREDAHPLTLAAGAHEIRWTIDPGQSIVESDESDNVAARTLVWLDGEIESHGTTGAMHCGLGPAAAGCFGYTAWDKEAMFEAIVWDMEDLTEEARIKVDSEGTSYVIGIVAPIPLLTPVESEACKGLGDQLMSYFSQKGS